MSVGKHVKHSHRVKGRQHDQAFDEVLEFVLAAGFDFPILFYEQMYMSSTHFLCGVTLQLIVQSTCIHDTDCIYHTDCFPTCYTRAHKMLFLLVAGFELACSLLSNLPCSGHAGAK